MTVKPFTNAASVARTATALALMASFGLPAHADGGVTAQCRPMPCPKPPCPAVPEPASVALVSVGAFALIPMAMRAMKGRRQLG